jgi:hypothetical protein
MPREARAPALEFVDRAHVQVTCASSVAPFLFDVNPLSS